MELLAPAGGKEQLEYAIRFGADAVYLACERFGMRQRADNFRLSEIPEVVAYAHERGVKVHITCNIVMHDEDIALLPSYLEALDAAGVDALIIGDLGALSLAKRYAPHCAIHVSTQASVSNAEAARVW
ncbi:MAG: peptidase U32 family protein, partial [Coriobacteriales bacterium]